MRIRPNLSGFKAETQAGVGSAFRTIGKVVGGLFAITGATQAAKSVLRAAADEQVALATVRQAIQQTDKQWTIHGQTVGAILTREARESGFSTQEVSQSFLRLETGTKNTTKSLALLSVAEDVSRGRHIDLASAAGLLARAQQGSYNALRRVGLVIPPVTKNVDELKKQHQAAVESGVKFTAATNAQYKASLAQAAALDAQATKVNVIAQVQQRFAGQTKTFANSAAGGYARLREEIRQFEASVGKDLLPTLSRGVGGLIQWVDGLRQSERVHKAVTSTVQGFAEGFHQMKAALDLIAPPLRLVVRLIGDVGKLTGGVGGIVGFVVAFKGVSLALGLAEAAQKKYQRALAIGRGEQSSLTAATSRDTASYNAFTAAIERNSIALAANAAAAERTALAQEAGGGAAALQGIGGAFQTVGAGAAAGATETAAAAEKVKEGFVASSEAVVGFTADSAVLADVTRHTAKDLGDFERGVLGVKKGLGEAAAAQGLYGRAQSGSNDEQAASAALAQKTSLAYREVAGSADASAAALDANAISAGRSAAALEAGAGASANRVAASFAGLGTGLTTAGTQGAVGLHQLDQSAQKAGAGLLTVSNQSASLAHHSQQLHQSFVKAGAGATAASAEVGTLTAAEARYVAALQAGLGPQAAATAAAGKEAEAYAALTTSTDLATASMLANARANIASAATAGASSAAQTGAALESLAAKEVQLASGARLLVPASVATKEGLKVVEEQAAKTAIRSAGLGATLKTLGKGLFDMAGGAKGAAVVGLAALGFAIYKVITAESVAERASKRLGQSLGTLGEDFKNVAGEAKKFSDAVSATRTDKIARDEASLALARAKSNVASLASKKGTAEYTDAVLGLRRAFDEYRLANRRVADDEKAAADARRARSVAEVARQRDVQEALKDSIALFKAAAEPAVVKAGRQFEANPKVPTAVISKDIDSVRAYADGLHKIAEGLKQDHPFMARQVQDVDLLTRALHEIPSPKTRAILVTTGSARAAVQQLIFELNAAGPSLAQFTAKTKTMEDALAGTDPVLSRKIGILTQFRIALGKIPVTDKQVKLILNTKDVKSSIAVAISELGKVKGEGGKAGKGTAQALAIAFATQLKEAGLVRSLKEGLAVVITESGKTLKQISEAAIRGQKTLLDAAKTSLRDARSALDSARQTASDAARQLGDSQRSLADAIRSGAQNVRDAVASANQNLASIGSGLQDSIDQFLDAQKKSEEIIGPSAKQFKNLQAQLAAGASPDDLARSSRALTNQIDQQQVVEGSAADKRKERSRRAIQDLSAQFSHGVITLATFNKRLAGILASDGITYKKAGKVLGFAFAEGYREQVKGILRQAAVINAGPHIPGVTGLEATIIKPLEAVRESQRQIKDAQRSVADSQRAQAKANRELAAAQAKLPPLVAGAARVESKLEDLEARSIRFIDEQTRQIAKAKENFAAAIKNPFAINAPGFASGFKGLGHGIGKGTEEGIRQAEGGVVAAIEGLIVTLLGAARKKAKAKSPSEETRDIGHDLGLGLAHGIRNSKPLVEQASGELAAASIRGLRHADDFFRQHVKHSFQLSVADEFKTLAKPLLGERGVPAAIEGKPHDRVMLAEALAHKRILTSQERHLGNLVQESRRQTALLHHRKPIPKPKRGGAAISGARLGVHAE